MTAYPDSTPLEIDCSWCEGDGYEVEDDPCTHCGGSGKEAAPITPSGDKIPVHQPRKISKSYKNRKKRLAMRAYKESTDANQ